MRTNERAIAKRGQKNRQGYHHTNKDPVLDWLAEQIRVSGLSYAEVAERAGIATTTVQAWAFGRTRRPQNCTVEAVGRALGYQRSWERVQ